MATQRVFDQRAPSPDEIQAAIQRGHRARSQALGQLLGALFSRRQKRRGAPALEAGLPLSQPRLATIHR
jgi:hypothetical protein